MSSITLSAATRQNLLSLQDTAALTNTTQNRLSTGKKVNSALDNPLSFFTAQSLNNRSGDLSSLLDGLSNGVQTIQAANQGITSIQKLIDSAKSIANQALASKNSTITTPAVIGSATGTATGAYTAPTGTALSFSFQLDGGTAKTGSIAVGDTIDTAIGKLNTAAGSAIFSKNAAGTNITINSAAADVTLASGTATGLGFSGASDITHTTAAAAVLGPDATRTSLATQYNTLLKQIDQLSGDAGFNGVNLLGGGGTNKLNIKFNETGKSSLDIQGVDFSSTGLNLGAVPTTGTGANFQADTDINTTITALNTASNTLRAQSSTFGSNLSIVQNRQDFSKNLINILDTGSANLTNADLNEEAANSQALSTRQSLGISALSLANQAQQGILQLLR
ncbi:flagellar protein [Methylobacterium sp. Leaf113]|uniref:flagellin N-terminal helical domain-containing protein n=1 Tax=Methylobacterium sp. Leaf113 TaxID=1736259 RepID=UPI0006F795A4|nr:flagellin [Methylobacterium sp. Leaf113]KQP79432.1 flagellar protein [Methylobacterium sp. Leaf113]